MGKRSSCLLAMQPSPVLKILMLWAKNRLVVAAICFGPDCSLRRVLSCEILCTRNNINLSGIYLRGMLRAKMALFQVRVAQMMMAEEKLFFIYIFF